MPDTDSFTLVKRMLYRGQQEEWSNTYHLSGTTPTTDAGWKALGDAIWASERHCYTDKAERVKMYGYAAGNEHSVYQWDALALGLTPEKGDLGGLSTTGMAGDQALTVRALVGTSSTGKKVYVRKYFHASNTDSVDQDKAGATAITAMVTHANLMLSGSLPGSMKWVGPQGATPTNVLANQYVTTRTLKRRGKRPS
jgi:hypothetical protein